MPIDISGAVVESLIGRRSPYIEVDPVVSALEELASYFRSVSALADAKRGWPEHQDDLDLSNGPVVTLTFGDSNRTPIPPAAIEDTSPQLWRTGELSIDVQLDLWAAYRASRDDAARAIEQALHNSLPWRHGLLLTSRGYYSRPLTARATDGRNIDEHRAATEGEWRRTWMLTVVTDLVSERDLPLQSTVTIRPTVMDVADPDYDIS